MFPLFHSDVKMGKEVNESTCPYDTGESTKVDLESVEMNDQSVRGLRQSIVDEKNLMDQLRNDMKKEISNGIQKNNDETTNALANMSRSVKCEDNTATTLSNTFDCYGFIMISPFSLSALYAWLILMTQIGIYALIIGASAAEKNIESEFARTAYVPVPVGVDLIVHIAQGLAIPVILLVQTSLWEGLLNIINGYSAIQGQGISYLWWLVAQLIRLLEGIMSSLVTFLIVVECDNVLDLFKDFTAITFVSSFDNIFFELAKMHVIGDSMFRQTEKCQSIQVRKRLHYRQKPTWMTWKQCDFVTIFKYWIIHPAAIGGVILVLIYFTWFYHFQIPQYRGDLLCQKIFLQMTDRPFQGSSSRSGRYDLLKGKDKRDYYPTYRESKESLVGYEDRYPTLLRFCNDIASWVITQEYPGEDGQKKECEEYFLLSENVKDEDKFDVFGVSQLFFLENGGNFKAGEFVYLTCQDKADPIEIKPCKEIGVDERQKKFVSVRNWSTNFSLLEKNDEPVRIYGKPVYININSTDNDIIFFTGYRWVMTYPPLLKDFQKFSENKLHSTDILSEYLMNDFHGYWSNYEVGFYSEGIIFGTAQDTSTPVGLKWHEASLKVNETNQNADITQTVDSKFICTFCDANDNKCFFESTCNSGKCTCLDGLSGSLCQVLPTSNGHCDEFFNERQYNYDGGDCCVETCKSTERYSCGRDAETGTIYVGYDMCKHEGDAGTWVRSESSSHLEGLIVTHVSLSANGRVLALIESISRSVRVYDNDGSDWVMRGPIVTNVDNPMLDTVQVSCHSHFLYHREILFPVTVSIISDSKIKIFEWKNVFWNETTPELITSTRTKNAIKVQLVNNGNSLGALFNDLSFKLFQREGIGKQWLETEVTNGTFTLFSLSEDAVRISLSHQGCIYVWNLRFINMSMKCVDREVKQIHISPSGHYLVALEQYEDYEGIIHRFDVREGHISEMQGIIRGVTSVDATIEISDTGTNILSHSGIDKKVRFFSWSNNAWQVNQQEILAEGFSIAQRADTLVLHTSRRNTFGIIEKWHNLTSSCPEGLSPVRLTFTADRPEALRIYADEYYAVGMFWRELGNNSRSFGPYYDSEGVLIAEDFCIKKTFAQDRCHALAIEDWGLDGLQSPPSMLTIAIDGKVVETIMGTSRASEFVSYEGNKTCMDLFNYFYTDYNAELHSDCSTQKCEWKENGRFFHGLKMDSWSRGFAFSANAKAVAVGQYHHKSETGQVGIWADQNGTWRQVGKNLTSGDLGSRFGYKVSMSSDGSIVAIGAHRSNVNITENGLNITKTRVGKVYVYRSFLSDHGSFDLKLMGNVIVGDLTSNQPQLGYSVSLSANGLYLAVSSREKNCSVIVYEFNVEKEEWVIQGNCINENVVDVYVTISSIGSVVVIGARKSAVKGENSGHVAVYRYNHLTNTWQRKGNVIEGEGEDHFLGYFRALSADGDVLAVGGQARFPLKVYKYEANKNIWQQRGQDIIFSSIKNYSAMALSSSGNELVYSYNNITRVRVYDEMKQLWLDTVSQVPRPAYEGDTPQIIVSADATIVAVRADDYLVSYELTKNLSNSSGICTDDEVLFVFTITPDQFPHDILWSVRSSNGVKTIGERLTKKNQRSITPLVIERCFKRDETHSFHIVDDYGDGICCAWGAGKFELKWDNKVLLTDTDFSQEKTVCLTQNEFAIFVIHFEEYSRYVSWQLTNSMNEVVLRDDGYTLSMAQCIQPHECHTFRVFEKKGNGTAFNIAYNGDELHSRNLDEKFFFDKAYIGCDRLPDRKRQFELEFLTNYNPEVFQWSLTSSDKGLIGAQDNILIDQLKFYNFSYTISLRADECLSLNLNETDGKGGTVYAVYWDGDLIESDMTNSYYREVNIGDCG